MSAASWIGEIVSAHEHLWDVYDAETFSDGRVILYLLDHYGDGTRSSAWADDAQVALQ